MNRPNLLSVGPAQSDLLIHFCGRPPGRPHTPHVPTEISDATPRARLDRILATETLRGFPPFGAEIDQPTVCLSESPPSHLTYLLNRGWQPWGLLFSRQWVYDNGGEPVAYMRKMRWANRRNEDKPWSVRLEPDPTHGWSDWTHEREWRILLDPQRPYIRLTQQSVAGVLVGDPSWRPTGVPSGDYVNQLSGELGDGTDPFDEECRLPPPIWATAPKWLWNPATRTMGIIAI